MKVREIVKVLEQIAPCDLAAEWDNVGLLVGDEQADAGGLLLCIDLTEQVLAEAVKAKARMVMAYHPVIFKPTAKVTASEGSVVYAAAAKGVAVHSMHTALDAAPGGTNDVLAEAVGIANPRPLEPTVRRGAFKIVVFTPAEDVSSVADAAFDAGAGMIGQYERCAFFSHGIGTFLGLPGTEPSVGQAGRQEATEELRLEFVAPRGRVAGICSAIRVAHGYEEPAIDVYPTEDAPQGCGMGRIGRLPRPVTLGTLINRIKKRTGLKKVLLATSDHRSIAGDGKGKLVSVAACAAGACGPMYKAAAAGGASFYLTGEMRHHDALAAAAAGLNVVCLGHSNSERITLKRLADRLSALLPKQRVILSKADRDPFEIV